MAEFGALTLLLALALAVYAALASFIGARRGIPELVVSGRYALYLNLGVLAVATVTLIMAFLQHDFAVRYVYMHSSRAMPPQYTWVAFYAGNEGSLLYIALALTFLTTLALRFAPKRVLGSLPYTAGVLALVQVFFVGVLVTLANPFAPLGVAATDGQGINPLLTHPGMFFHPPTLMTGLVSCTMPFAFAMGALLSGRVGDEWVDAGRIWGIVAWAVLGLGLLLGAWWAYTILGWGGYWAWDPVENAGLMPWLGLTAFVHSIMVQARRGMFRMWNIAIMIITYVLAAFGMFLNRGGPVPSVHSFGASTLGWVFLGYLGVAAAASFLVFFLRYDRLKSDNQLESTFSREAAFLLNNVLLLSIAFVTLWGVTYPLFSDLFFHQQVSVGAPFYNRVNGPLIMAMIALMGVAPMLPWRTATARHFFSVLLAPGLVAVAVMVVLVGFGMRNVFAVLAFGIFGLVVGSVLEEWVRGAISRHRKGESYPVALVRLIGANRPRYGGYVVHLAIIMLALGVTGSQFFGIQEDVVLAQGERQVVGGYTLAYTGSNDVEFPDRHEQVVDVEVFRGDKDLGLLHPRRTFYPEQRIAATQAAIRSTPAEDLYIIPSDVLDDGRMVFRVLVNPLVWWMWMSGPVLLLGTIICLWPRRRATAPVRATAPQRMGTAGAYPHVAPMTRTPDKPERRA